MFDVPEGRRYLDTHEWFDPETGRIGISEFAQDELGDVVFVEVPDEGDTVAAGAEFGVVESIKAVSELYAPVGGTVTARNAALETAPELVNDDPYGEGWLVEVDAEDVPEDLLSAAEYAEQIE
jgi:glycine cleavage system H protein